MANVRLELTTEQFIKAFGDQDEVKKFSPDAIEAILENMSCWQDGTDGDPDFDWTDSFMEAGELTPKQLCNDYSGEIEDRAYQILHMANLTITGLKPDVEEKLTAFTSQHGSNDGEAAELLRELLPEFEAMPEWTNELAKFLAEAKGFDDLPNGNYIYL